MIHYARYWARNKGQWLYGIWYNSKKALERTYDLSSFTKLPVCLLAFVFMAWEITGQGCGNSIQTRIAVLQSSSIYERDLGTFESKISNIW